METSGKKRNVDEMLKKEQGQGEEDILAGTSLGREMEGLGKLEVSDTEDEEEQGFTPLISACRKDMTEVCYA